MKNDRKLLELAAQAADIKLEWFESSVKGGRAEAINIGVVWTPLTDDGDRLRLARQLRISNDFADCYAWKRLTDGSLIQEFWGGDSGDEAHAVLRVAAEIGNKMFQAA
jgi:hypothetical protein